MDYMIMLWEFTRHNLSLSNQIKMFLQATTPVIWFGCDVQSVNGLIMLNVHDEHLHERNSIQLHFGIKLIAISWITAQFFSIAAIYEK